MSMISLSQEPGQVIIFPSAPVTPNARDWMEDWGLDYDRSNEERRQEEVKRILLTEWSPLHSQGKYYLVGIGADWIKAIFAFACIPFTAS